MNYFHTLSLTRIVEKQSTSTKSLLAGEITILMTMQNAPVAFPEKANELIFNAEIRAGNVVIKGSDSHPDFPQTVGTNFSFFLNLDSIDLLV